MKGLLTALIALFVLWVVDVNFNGGRYTDAALRMIRTTVASVGVRI